MEPIQYRLVRSDRKTVAIQLMPEGEVVVRCPRRMPLGAVERFVTEKRSWIEKHLAMQLPKAPPLTKGDLQKLTEQAKTLLPDRVAHYARLVGVTYGRITVRSQKSRWGSCSAKGNLSFNCLLMLVPEQVADYVVVHELCHRKEMNHSARFWGAVASVMPDYRVSRQWLKEQGVALIARLGRGGENRE